MAKGKKTTRTATTIAASLSMDFHKDMASIIGVTLVRTVETLSKDYVQGMGCGRPARIGFSSIRANTVLTRSQGMGCILGTMGGLTEETSKTTTEVDMVNYIIAKMSFSTRASGSWANKWIDNMQNSNYMLNKILSVSNLFTMSSLVLI